MSKLLGALALSALALTGCSGITNEAKPAGLNDVPGGDWTGDVRTITVGSNQQTLVQDEDGNWVEACSINYSRCVSGSTTRYEQCARSVEDPGAEDWYQGSCNSGLVCEQGVLEARCVDEDDPPPPSGDRNIHCSGTTVTVTGPLRGGTVIWPSNPYRLLYGMDVEGRTDGWYMPNPASLNRQYRAVGNVDDDVAYAFTGIPRGSRLNFYVQDRSQSTPSSRPPNYWFSLDGNAWTVTGDCRKENLTGYGWAIRTSGGTNPPPPSGDEGEISCVRTSSNLDMTITGPINERLVASRDGSPGLDELAYISYGSNAPSAEWNESEIMRLAEPTRSPRAHVDPNGDVGPYLLRLPRDANYINPLFVDVNGDASWADFVGDNGGDGSKWVVTGDCRLVGTTIQRR